MKAAHELDPRPEEAWFGRSIDELADLRALVLDAGHSQAIANGIVGLIVGGQADQEVTTAPGTLATYRRVLRELAPDGPPRRRRRAVVGRQRGAASLALVGAGSSSGTLAMAAAAAQAGHTGLSLALVAAAPIILAPSPIIHQTATQWPVELAVAA